MEAALVAAIAAMFVSGIISYIATTAKNKNRDRATTKKDSDIDVRIDL